MREKPTYSDIKAALPKTVRRTARYKVVPQNQCPVSKPSVCFRSPQNKMMENPYKICVPTGLTLGSLDIYLSSLTRLWYRALATQSQKAVFVKNSFLWPRIYSWG